MTEPSKEARVQANEISMNYSKDGCLVVCREAIALAIDKAVAGEREGCAVIADWNATAMRDEGITMSEYAGARDAGERIAAAIRNRANRT